MKAVVIISGGLDSSLVIKAIQNQGIEVIALHFLIPFVMHDNKTVYSSAAAKIAQHLGAKFKLVVLGDEYLEMLFKPEHGYGKNLNPCIDCKILMLRHAKKIMQTEGASFVATGEVLGQRPMSQYKVPLAAIAKESGLGELLVRPLSAKLLPETIPQKEGWLKDDFLFDFKGRGRTRQMALAKKWGIKEYPWPGGGCFLTEPNFCRRLKDLIEHKQCTLSNIELLKTGRHFRFSPDFKLVVGRNEKENEKIMALAQNNDICFEPKDLPGPTAIGKGRLNEDARQLAAQIIARYTDPGNSIGVTIRPCSESQGDILTVDKIDEASLTALRI